MIYNHKNSKKLLIIKFEKFILYQDTLIYVTITINIPTSFRRDSEYV